MPVDIHAEIAQHADADLSDGIKNSHKLFFRDVLPYAAFHGESVLSDGYALNAGIHVFFEASGFENACLERKGFRDLKAKTNLSF